MNTSRKQPTFTTREFVGTDEPARRRSWWWLLGALVVVMVVTIVVAAIVTTSSSSDPDSSTDQPSSPGQSEPGAQVSFATLRWEQVGRTELPFSSTAGPRTVDGVAASGFAHSEAGAILASWQIPMRLSVLGGTDDIYRDQVLGTPGDISRFKQSVAELQASFDTDQTVPRVIAWRAHQPYDEQVASYDFALPGQTSTAVSLLRFSVVWMGGDWRYQPGLFGNATTGPVDAASVNEGNGWHRFEQGHN